MLQARGSERLWGDGLRVGWKRDGNSWTPRRYTSAGSPVFACNL